MLYRYMGCQCEEQIQWAGNVDPRGLLEVGMDYVVERTEVHTWHTKVFLTAFPNKQFNSVWFEQVQ